MHLNMLLLLGHVYNQVWMTRDEEFLQYHDRFLSEKPDRGRGSRRVSSLGREDEKTIHLMGSRPIDTFLTEGDVLPGHPEFTVLESLGHAQSHLVFWSERTAY